MNKERVLKEAQKIAANFSFWMVSGNISHLYGNVYETSEKKYDLEIQFDERFPDTPPQFTYHDEIKDLLGNFQLQKLRLWTPGSSVVEIVDELKIKIQEAISKPKIIEGQYAGSEKLPIQREIEDELGSVQPTHDSKKSYQPEEYITPDLNAYPENLDFEEEFFQDDKKLELNSTNEQKIQPDYQENKQI